MGLGKCVVVLGEEDRDAEQSLHVLKELGIDKCQDFRKHDLTSGAPAARVTKADRSQVARASTNPRLQGTCERRGGIKENMQGSDGRSLPYGDGGTGDGGGG